MSAHFHLTLLYYYQFKFILQRPGLYNHYHFISMFTALSLWSKTKHYLWQYYYFSTWTRSVSAPIWMLDSRGQEETNVLFSLNEWLFHRIQHTWGTWILQLQYLGENVKYEICDLVYYVHNILQLTFGKLNQKANEY